MAGWRKQASIAFLLAVALSGCKSVSSPDKPPDLIVVNAKIFTADPSNSWSQALAVRGDRITALGSSDKILSLSGPATRVVDASARLMIPGINDAHYHSNIGPDQLRVEVSSMDPSFYEVEQELLRLAPAASEGQWLTAVIGPTALEDVRADRESLDRISSGVPILLKTWWGHGSILNTPALRLLGIRDDEPDPPGGSYLRNAQGRISGVLHEYADYAARKKFSSLASQESAVRAIRDDAAAAIRFGITSIQEMSTSWDVNEAARVIREASVPIRWRLIRFPMTNKNWRNTEPEGRSEAAIRITGVKWILDGTPIERLAYMREPYLDVAGSARGRLNFSEDEIHLILKESSEAGEQVMVHAVGDKTIDVLLSAMEATGGSSYWRPRRLRIEHGDYLTQDQWNRVRDLGVIIVQNPSHFMTAEMLGGRHSKSVATRAQAVGSILRAGIPLAFGSDGPLNPFLNIMFASIHQANPGEALSREEALQAYTQGSAFSEFAETEKGMLREGMLADFAILSANIFEIPLPELPGVESVFTVIGGTAVHDQLPTP